MVSLSRLHSRLGTLRTLLDEMKYTLPSVLDRFEIGRSHSILIMQPMPPLNELHNTVMIIDQHRILAILKDQNLEARGRGPGGHLRLKTESISENIVVQLASETRMHSRQTDMVFQMGSE